MLLDVAFQLFQQAVVGDVAVLEHDEGLRLDQPVGVLFADDGGLQHRFVRDQGRFHIERRHPLPTDLEHVVGAAAVIVIAIGVAPVFVAGIGPIALEGAAALGALVPVTFAGRRSAHDQFADLIGAQLASKLIHQLDVITRNWFAGGTVADVTRPVADESLQHLGRADAVEHVDADDLAPALADMRRQGLARRDAKPQPVRARARSDFPVREQRRIERGHTIENGRVMLAHDVEDCFRCRTLRPQYGGGADRKRKRHGVAHAVGEEQLGRRVNHVVGANSDDALTHQLGGRHRAAVHVLDAFRIAGRA